MTIYLVEIGWRYEGAKILGVFDSLDKAKAFCQGRFEGCTLSWAQGTTAREPHLFVEFGDLDEVSKANCDWVNIQTWQVS